MIIGQEEVTWLKGVEVKRGDARVVKWSRGKERRSSRKGKGQKELALYTSLYRGYACLFAPGTSLEATNAAKVKGQL